MNPVPDVAGFHLEEAINILEKASFKVKVLESRSKKTKEKGILRVIRQKKISQNEFELIVSYF